MKNRHSNIRKIFTCNYLFLYFTAKTILKRLFRVYAHIYHQHFKEVVSLGEEAHLNTSFKHFIYFVQEFELIEKKELAPLQELIDRLTSLGSNGSSVSDHNQHHSDPTAMAAPTSQVNNSASSRVVGGGNLS